ncbi:hypothetical protein M2168_001500 [Streptomyces sp. CZ24]|nr:hypothetical protein [Streptomyces sp. CZ24]
MGRHRHLRAARARLHHAPPGDPRGVARHLRGARPPGGRRPPGGAGGDRRRAAAGAPVRPRGPPAAARARQLLGVQLAGLVRAARRLRRGRHHRAAGRRVPRDGPGAARGRHRGHPRRGLQPHRRGRGAGPHPQPQGHRQRRVLPPSARRPPLRRLHRLRQHPARGPAARAAADHRLAAVLGHRDGRGRLPLRPGGGAGPLLPRRGHALAVPRGDRPGPGAAPGQADRRTVGRRHGRLPGGRLPAAVDRVERPLPRRRPRLLARRPARRTRPRLPALRLQRPLCLGRPPPARLRQLRHRPRRFHPARPGLLRAQAQRGQRRGEPRRHRRQPLLELRRRGRERRPGRHRAPPPPAPQPADHPAALHRRPDAHRRRRDGPHPGRQQQRLLPGRRDQLGRLVAARGPGVGRPAGPDPPADRAAPHPTPSCAAAPSSPGGPRPRTGCGTWRGSPRGAPR